MIRSVAFLVAGCAAAFSQTPESAVIRINVNLVQVDAVVTNSKHEHVRDLKVEDFELLQDGKPQKITNFSYVGRPPAPSSPAFVPAVPEKRGVPAPPPVARPMKPSDARRMIALVVDDLGLSFAGIVHVRDALGNFVDQEMQPGDMVAIVRTSGGMGALQQFTTDRTLLHAAIDHVKFTTGRVGVDSFALTDREIPADDSHEQQAVTGRPMFLSGTFAAIEYVLAGLRDLPGRKSLVLFSESMGVSRDTIRAVVDSANRASVVIYTIDPRGVPAFAFSAAENVAPSSKRGAMILDQRNALLFNSRQGLAALAEETGGLFFHDDNFVNDALHRAVDNTEGYYLLGYHPDPSTFDVKTGRLKFHQLRVRVKSARLQVRSRMGFLGQSEEDVSDAPRTREAQLIGALTSPFSSGSIHVRLTSMFNRMPDGEPGISALLYIDAKDLDFAEEPDGQRKATLEVAAWTFGDSGTAVDQSDRSFTVALRHDQYDATLKKGLIYSVNLPVRKPGPYQMRVAVRDASSAQLGSASQFIEIPDLKNGRLELSSILLRQDTGAASSDAGHSEGRVSEPDPAGSAAVRIFKPGDALVYGYFVFNARTDLSKKADLVVETRLSRDNQRIYRSQPMIPNLGTETDAHTFRAGGHFQLAASITPGDYVLQVIVADKLARARNDYASQWIDFEVEK